MSDHIHLIWQMQLLIHPQHVQRDFLKYTAQRIKHDLQKNQPELLLRFEADANDRTYQFWKRSPLSIELRTDKVYLQKLNYTHNNPVKAGICNYRRNTTIHQRYSIKPRLTIGDFFIINAIEAHLGGGWKKNTRHSVNIIHIAS